MIRSSGDIEVSAEEDEPGETISAALTAKGGGSKTILYRHELLNLFKMGELCSQRNFNNCIKSCQFYTDCRLTKKDATDYSG